MPETIESRIAAQKAVVDGLITAANNKTGVSFSDLPAAVEELIDGYHSGGQSFDWISKIADGKFTLTSSSARSVTLSHDFGVLPKFLAIIPQGSISRGYLPIVITARRSENSSSVEETFSFLMRTGSNVTSYTSYMGHNPDGSLASPIAVTWGINDVTVTITEYAYFRTDTFAWVVIV